MSLFGKKKEEAKAETSCCCGGSKSASEVTSTCCGDDCGEHLGICAEIDDQYRNCMRLSFGQQWSPFIEERLQVLGSVIKESF